MKQDPLNDKVKPGATVQITISKGPSRTRAADPVPEQPTNPGTNNPGGTTDPGTTDPAAPPTWATRAATPAPPPLPPTRDRITKP
ncbi:MAG: hypothetical protein ACLTSX_13175 [Collinsella sp.]